MRMLLLPLVLLAAVGTPLPSTCLAESPTDALARCNVVWTTPSENIRGTMPIGNGDIGANVWMGPSGVFEILLSKTDAWDGNGQLCKLGTLRVACEPNPFEKPTTFRQELDLRRGCITIDAQHATHGKATLRFWIDANQPVARVEVEAEKPLTLSVTHHTWRTTQHEVTDKYGLSSLYGIGGSKSGEFPLIAYPDTVLEDQHDQIAFFHRNTTSIWGVTLRKQALDGFDKADDDPLLHRTFGAIVRGPGLVSRAKDVLTTAQPVTRQQVDIYPLTARTATAEQWVNIVEQNIERIGKTPLDAARQAHEKWWGDFWNRSWIFVGGDKDSETVTRAYVLQRWINACGGRGGAPIKFNGSIFTVWDIDRHGAMTYDPDFRMWGPCYWWQNTRLPYWPSLATGDHDLMRPLFQMYFDALPLRKYATQRYYGHAGAFFPETMYFFGTYNNENYGWKREGLPDSLTTNRHIRYEWVGGIELTAMMLDYCTYSGDQDLLRERVLPFANEVVTFYAQHYPPREGGDKLHIYPSNALEDVWDATNPAEVISGLKAILPRMIALADNPEQKQAWSRILAQVPELPTVVRKDGIAMFAASAAGGRRRNGEKSELYAVFPFRVVNRQTPETLPLALAAYQHRALRGIHGWVQDAIFAADLGLTEDARKQLVPRAGATSRWSRFPAFWGPNFDWVPDQCHGGVNMVVLQEMLMQPVGDKLVLLPAWPATWDADFKLHGPRQTVLEGTVRAGELTELKVTPESRRADVIVADGGK